MNEVKFETMVPVNPRCKECKHFMPTEGIRGICGTRIGSISEECTKYQWCKDFEPKTSEEVTNEK